MTRPARRALLLLALANLGAGVVACKKPRALAEGDACLVSRVECVAGAKAALVCGESGVFVQVPCRGPKGCAPGTAEVAASCDFAVGAQGDACVTLPHKARVTCTDDARTGLLCQGGRLVPAVDCTRFDCRVDERRLECAAMTAAVGYACEREGETFCGEDARSLLRCRDGKLERHRLCHGKLGCKGGRDPACDDTLGNEGDPCTLSGLVVCAEDGQSELVCQNGRLARGRACPRAGCQVADIAQKRIDCR